MRIFRSSMFLFLCVNVVSGFLLTAELSAQETTDESVPLKSERVVHFEKPVHFLTQQDEDATVPPGPYSVELVEGGLRLVPTEPDQGEAVTIRAQTTRHEQVVEFPEPFKMSGEESDQQVVLLLMPDGKALKAIGTYSGIHRRGYKPKFRGGFFKKSKLATIQSLFTTPKLFAMSPGGQLYLKGKNFGSSKGQVMLFLYRPRKTISLAITKWTPTQVNVQIPQNIIGALDHKAGVQIRPRNGAGLVRKIPFYAKRAIKELLPASPAVKIVQCSNGGDINKCNLHNASTNGGEACSRPLPPVISNKFAIRGYHENCDHVFDHDNGTDVYEIKLKNGWVFQKIDVYRGRSSTDKVESLVSGPVERRDTLIGGTYWKPKFDWWLGEREWVYYTERIWIEGPEKTPEY